MRTLLCLLFAASALALAQDQDLPPDDPKNRPDATEEEAAPAKSEAEVAADKEAMDRLSAAMRVHKTNEHLFVSVNVKHEPPDVQQGGDGAQVRHIIRVSGMGTGQPFEGDAEGWYGPDGVTVIASKEALPGFALYLKDDRAIKEVTYETDVPSLAQLKAELGAILDPARLVRKLFDAELKHRTDVATGEITFTGKVPREIVKVTLPEGMGGMMFPGGVAKVLKAQGELVVSKEGRFKKIKISVTRNDPMAEAMRNQGGFRVVIQGGGQPAPQKKKADDEKHDIEGGTTHYTLTFDRDGPSERAQAFKKRVSGLVE